MVEANKVSVAQFAKQVLSLVTNMLKTLILRGTQAKIGNVETIKRILEAISLLNLTVS